MTKLNTANIGMNKYCGPAVLSILTGKSTDECARVISSVNGQYKIEGVELKHLLTAAERLGFDYQSISPSGSLYGTLTRIAINDGMYIITLPNHFAAIEVNNKQIYFCDNHTKEPIPAAASARLLQKVLAVNKVFKRPETIIPPAEIRNEKQDRINNLKLKIDAVNNQIRLLNDSLDLYRIELRHLLQEN